MNDRNSFFMVIALTLLGGLFVMLSILLGGGNEIAAFYQYLLGALFIAGVATPRGAFIFWLVLCGYTDLLKRLMVVTGRVSFNDLYYILGLPPVMLGAITLSVVIGGFSGRFQLRRLHWTMLAISCVIIIAVAGLTASGGGSLTQTVLPAIANSGLYFLLLFLVPSLFQTSEEVVKLLKILLWCYLPVALYGIFQQVYGYREFEIDYLKSGLSIEIKQLLSNEVRAFSTLNSTTALATISGALFSVAVILMFLPRDASRRGRVLGWVPGLLMATAYFGGMVASTGRAALSFIVCALVGAWCFRSRRLMLTAYACGLLSFIALIFSAEKLLSNMNFFQDEVASAVNTDHGFMGQMTRVGTYSDRLMGFKNLVKNKEVWTWFGHHDVADDDQTLFSHDILTNALVHYGVVPVGLALIMLGIGLFRSHHFILSMEDPLRRSLSAALLALALSFLALSLLAGNVLVIFPINVFACLFGGMMLVVFQQEWSAEAPAPEIAADTATCAMPERRAVYRFARTGRAFL